MSLLSVGISGLNVSQTALEVTGNNIANAGSASYSRQRVETATSPEQLRGAGYVGSGLSVTDITRVVDQFLINQVQMDTATYHNLETIASNIGKVDTLLADEQSGLGPAIDRFYKAIEASAQDPTSEPARQVVLSEAEGLTQRINDLTAQLLQQTDAVNSKMTSVTQQISTIAEGLAELNTRISDEISRSGGSQPNQLLDSRDEMLRQLSELTGFTTIENNGSVDVLLGNGQPLVVGGTAAKLGTAPSTTEPGDIDITFIDQNGFEQVVTRFMSGGELGGLIEFRDDIVSETVNSLGRIALGIADTMNQQNALGVDLDGNMGGNIFGDINAGSIPGQRVVVNSSNSAPGSQAMAVNITDIGQLTTSDYKLNVIDNNGDGLVDYQLVRSSDNTVTIFNGTGPGVAQSLAVDGFSIDIPAGTPANLALGDTFNIRPTRTAGSDMTTVMTRVQELAYASPVRTTTDSNQGVISSGEVLALVDDAAIAFSPTNPLYSAPGVLAGEVLIRFTSPTAYTVYENSDATSPEALFSGTIIPGQDNAIFDTNSTDPNYLGIQVNISGVPATGDEFRLSFNDNGSSDNRNAIALGAVRFDDTLDGGSTSFENAYGSLVEEVGTRTAQANLSRDAAESSLQQSQASRDSKSGVNLDEEAANLIKFEQSYNANAQVINIARQIFDTLIRTLG